MSNAVVQIGVAEDMGNNKKLLRALIGGTIEMADMKLIIAWAEGLNKSIEKACGGFAQSVCVLMDISKFEKYSDSQIIIILSELMKRDNRFVYRTATFGGNDASEFIVEIIRGMSNRSNLKSFDTEEQALAWLKS